ncbi:Vitamin B12 transporter BtuB [Dyadobacter sp. CECT 9275]|uniref:Vitamin B12 transporter BtuB n=1 Tax=Dyadobacter helix TaxID=2822344 RepID=A0A916JH48_9BACT|nr:TonB-dependent receptor plug domain-containing protein [Dyadobacter sp. CECT 9275]CAG5010269.1 Vitamin B12 transporter BtuB [Dyadobacter sp. CECT 9275]
MLFSKTRRLLVIFTGMVMLAFTMAEEDFSQWISDKLFRYRMAYPQEKAYLHLDKPYYASGDTLWFKAYLAEGAVHLADSASQVLYVDLIEQQTGKNVGLRRVPLLGGTGHGDFVLNDKLNAGAYTVRAYTNWMRNFSEDFFFQKDIYLFNNQEQPAVAAAQPVDLQFFPEGGRLVDGTGTRVAFKATSPNGLGAGISGFILANKDTVSAFKSSHLGMGQFSFTPDASVRYTVVAKTGTGDYQRYSFPEVEKTGYTMIVDNTTFTGKMRILVYHKAQQPVDKQVFLVGHSRGVVVFSAKGKVSSKGLIMNLPTLDLPEGITHITLFDEHKLPLCERLVFIDHNKSLRVKITPERASYIPKSETAVEIAVTDSEGRPVEASVSVSVTDAAQILIPPYGETITSYLLLSSDLKGSVEQPAYYFDTSHTERRIYLDYVMMVNGWSRFKWTDVLKDSLTTTERFVERGLTLQGEVLKNNRKVNEEIPLSFYLTNDSLNTFMTTGSDKTGKFAVYNLVFTDSLQVRIQGTSKRGRQNLSFNLFPFTAPRVTLLKVPFYPVTVEAAQMKEFLTKASEYQEIERKIRENRERLLNEVTIKGKKEVERDSRKLYNRADASVKVTPQLAGGAMSVLDLLAGRVAGVQVSGYGMNATVSIRGSQREPQFVLDGIPVDKSTVLNLNVNDVESIDVLKGASAAIYGSQGGSGVISVLTKRGNENYDYSQDVVPGVLVTKIPGLDAPREFYAPRYGVNMQLNNRPDFRSTVYWAPMLRTGKDGRARIRYFNTSAQTSINIRAEVFSAQGASGTGIAVYSVH